ncbi:hypothetical protein HG530_012716 [Fusarium avenaceum]|nr:hypothetical protein HG530_012716 [Fusarium avenaceum]
MNRIIPFKVRSDAELNTQHRSGHGLNLSLNLDTRELGYQATNSSTFSGQTKKLAHARRIQIKIATPRHIDSFSLLNNTLRAGGKLAQRRHGWPHALLGHLAEVQGSLGDTSPALLHRDLKDSTQDTASRLCYIYHIGHQSQALELEATGSVRAIKVEEALLRIHAQEARNIFVVGKCGRQTKDSNWLASLFRLADSSADNAFQHRTAIVVKQMDFVNNDEAHHISVGQVVGLSGDNIPLLRCSDDNLCLGNLLLGLKSVAQVADLFLDKSLEGSDTDDLESIEINIAGLWVAMLSNLSKNREHTHIVEVDELSRLESTNKLTIGTFSLGPVGSKRSRNINVHLDVHLSLLGISGVLALEFIEDPMETFRAHLSLDISALLRSFRSCQFCKPEDLLPVLD